MTAWIDHAACSGREPELFFDTCREALALQVCAACPVRAECLADVTGWEPHLAGASYRKAYFGVRGGLTGAQRYELGQPQHAPAAY